MTGGPHPDDLPEILAATADAVQRALAEGVDWSLAGTIPGQHHSDLAADAAAVAAAGTTRPLAAAMLRLPDPLPERVDQLLGRPLAAGSRMLTACTLVGTAALVATVVGLVVAPEDPALPALPLLALAMPALLACRRHATRA